MVNIVKKVVRGLAFASALIAAAAFGVPVAFAQQATNPIFTLYQQGVWYDLGQGPMTVQMVYGGAVLNVGSGTSCSNLTSAAGGVTLGSGNSNLSLASIPFNTTLHVCASIVGRVAAQIVTTTLGYLGFPARFNHWHAYCNCYDNLP